MAAPMIINVCGNLNLTCCRRLFNHVLHSSPVTHQIRGKKVNTALPELTTQTRATIRDKSLTEENEEFLDNVVTNLYANQPEYTSPLADGPWKRNAYTNRTLRTGVLAIKIGIIPQWTKNGKRVTTTLLQIVDNHVIKYTPPEILKTEACWVPRWKGKYGSVLVGAISTDPRKFTESYNKTFLEAGVPPKVRLTRFLVTPDAAIQPGTPLNAMHFRPGDYVDCSAQTIHRGFQGAIKRWGFKGLPKTHGVTKKHRSLGGIGGKTIKATSGVWKGKKMPGVMGGKWRTLRGLKIFRINTKYNVLYVKGQNIAGETHTFVRIHDTVLPLRKRKENTPPMPTWYPEDETEPIKEEYFDEDLFQFSSESLSVKT